jgi:hypothetical protein
MADPKLRIGDHIVSRGRVLEATLFYPRLDDEFNVVEVDLCDVRAADSIQIRFDFDRNGWSIAQASTFEWAADDDECDPDWQEVAFVPAWGREKPGRLDETLPDPCPTCLHRSAEYGCDIAGSAPIPSGGKCDCYEREPLRVARKTP